MPTGSEALILNLLVLAVSGLTSVLVGVVFRRLGDVGKDVKEIGEKVGKHAEQLARGSAEIEELQRRVANLDGEVRRLLTEGCARGRECMGRGP